METHNTNISLLRTKLYRPPVPADHVHRSKLLEQLEEAPHRPLVLVSAPAGYGKTTLVSCWLDICDRPFAWLSLDGTANDLRQFLSYLVAALQSIFHKGIRDTESLIQRPNLPSIPVLGITLINELDCIEQDFVLVLDDIHCIREKPVHEFLDFLLRQPPRPLQLVMVGRRDPILPLASLRAKGLMTEIRMRDLHFTPSEGLQFLKKAVGEHMGKPTAEALTQKSEGWVTGLRLAALVMRGQEDPVRKLLELKGTTRYVMDYMMGEVLDGLSPEIRHCLLSTAILNRFNDRLCDTLLDADKLSVPGDVDGEGLINWLRHENLFIISLDMENQWFRYHHLFQQLLQDQLKRKRSPEEIAILHNRASEWFESQSLITESIEHALSAGNTGRAVDIIERHRDNEFTADRWYVVKRWLTLLPVQIRCERPKLLVTEAWIRNLQHQLDRVPMLLDQAEALLPSRTEGPTVSSEVAFFRGYTAYFEGQGERSLQYLEDSVSHLAGTKSPFLGEAELMLGLARFMAGRKGPAIHGLEARIREVDSSEHYLRSRLIAGLAFIHQLRGDRHAAMNEAKHLQAVSFEHKLGLAEAWSYYFLGCSHLQAGGFEAASHHFAQAAKRRYVLEPRGAVDAMAGLVLAQQFMGLFDEAEDSCRLLREFARELNERNYLSVAQSCQARLYLLRKDLNSALEWGRSMDESPSPAELFSWLEAPSITQARVLIAAGSHQKLLDATRLLQAIRELCEACRFTCHIIEVGVLQSLALEKLGRNEEACHALEEIVSLSRPGGWVRPFVEAGPPILDLLNRLLTNNTAVDYVEEILAAFGDEGDIHVGGAPVKDPAASAGRPVRPSTPIQPLLEPLTHRELDVLELLSRRLQNKEIGEKLSISPLTVKSHLQSIYQKLCVENRRQAVKKSSELGILRI